MAKPFILGLTGSIGMGKSTVSQMFRDAGVAVWDADSTVHRLYSKGGKAVRRISAIRPEAVFDGQVSRDALKIWIAEDPTALEQIEAQVHPLVAEARFDFLEDAEAAGRTLVVLDVPLLFETKGDRLVDAVLVVTAPPEIQRARVLARPGMTEDQFQAILAKQVPDAEKRDRADYVIESVELEPTRAAVMALIDRLKTRVGHA